jgi:hypothetical protein
MGSRGGAPSTRSTSLVVIDDGGARAVDPASFADAERLDWPLDFLTPVARVAALPGG